jgi:hypothetical protein
MLLYVILFVRYGHHSVSAGILSQLREQVSSEHFHFWLVSLEELSRGEAELLDCSKQPSLVQRLSQTVAHYSKSVAALKVKWCNGFMYKKGIYQKALLHPSTLHILEDLRFSRQ